MIELYTGTPGSGKSLHSAHVILNWAKKRPVVLNFEINIPDKLKSNYHFIDNADLHPSILIKFAREFWFNRGTKPVEDYILLIIDESQLLLNCRDWGNKNRAAWLSFFTQHRKLGYRIILVAQFDAMLDKQVRALVEYEYIHRKVANYGFLGKLLSILTFGQVFACIRMWYPVQKKLDSYFFKGHKKFYKMYDTFNTFEQA